MKNTEITTVAKWTTCDRCHCIIDKYDGREIKLTHRVFGAQGMEDDWSIIDLCNRCQDAVYDFIRNGIK